MNQIACEAFTELESDVKQEFYEDISSAVDDVMLCAQELDQTVDSEVIDRMFRAIHTVKGNCNMVFLGQFVESMHQLEDFFSEIRSGNIDYHAVYGQFAEKIVVLIRVQLKQLIETTHADGEILDQCKHLITQLLQADNKERESLAKKAIAAIDAGHFSTSLIVQQGDSGHAFSFMDATDIEFFEFISSGRQQNDSCQDFYPICLAIAQKLNQMLTNQADPDQLKAAIIFLYLSRKNVSQSDFSELNVQQCIMASGILSRMAGWSNASELCIQAMECHDGSGLPNGLAASQILPAAQVVRLAFDFSYNIVKTNGIDYKQRLFSAVKSINAHKDSYYKDRLIQRFNQLIKTDYLTQQKF
ncbi:MAG: Hpt domain-containing protein [Enterobacterales bacterium]|nr:Hpt domain-containing protein [Enterobacterales bacterium]